MRKWTIAAAALTAAIFGDGEAQATNCATVTFSAPTISGWNPLTGANGSASFTATATRITTVPSVRMARIIFLDNDTGVTKIGTAGPQYDVLDGSGNVVSAQSGTSVPTSSSIIQFSWGNGGSNVNTANFTVRVLPTATQDFIAGTSYSEALKYSIQCFGAPPGNAVLGADTNVSGAPTLSLTVPSLLSITTAGPYNVNFGSFTSTTSNVNIGLKSTSSINVTLSTTNGSEMVLSGAVSPFPTNSVIAYTMTLNGTAISSGPQINLARAGVSGALWPLVLTLQNNQLPTGKLAGGYSDTITLTLTPGT